MLSSSKVEEELSKINQKYFPNNSFLLGSQTVYDDQIRIGNNDDLDDSLNTQDLTKNLNMPRKSSLDLLEEDIERQRQTTAERR